MIRTALLAAVAAVALTSTAHAGKCVVTTATGVGATKELATVVASASLATAIATAGTTAKGKTVVKTSGDFPLVTAKASQRNCK